MARVIYGLNAARPPVRHYNEVDKNNVFLSFHDSGRPHVRVVTDDCRQSLNGQLIAAAAMATESDSLLLSDHTKPLATDKFFALYPTRELEYVDELEKVGLLYDVPLKGRTGDTIIETGLRAALRIVDDATLFAMFCDGVEDLLCESPTITNFIPDLFTIILKRSVMTEEDRLRASESAVMYYPMGLACAHPWSCALFLMPPFALPLDIIYLLLNSTNKNVTLSLNVFYGVLIFLLQAHHTRYVTAVRVNNFKTKRQRHAGDTVDMTSILIERPVGVDLEVWDAWVMKASAHRVHGPLNVQDTADEGEESSTDALDQSGLRARGQRGKLPQTLAPNVCGQPTPRRRVRGGVSDACICKVIRTAAGLSAAEVGMSAQQKRGKDGNHNATHAQHLPFCTVVQFCLTRPSAVCNGVKAGKMGVKATFRYLSHVTPNLLL